MEQKQQQAPDKKNAPFFKFKDDQYSEPEKESMEYETQSEYKEEKHEHDKKAVNAREGVTDDDEEKNAKQSQQQQQRKEEEKETAENEKQSEKKKRKSKTSVIAIFFVIIFSLIFNTIFLYPLIIVCGVIKFLITFCCCCVQKIKQDILKFYSSSICLIVIPSSIIIVVVQSVMCIFIERDTYSLWYIDNFFLFLSHIMIYTIVEMTKRDNYSFECENIIVNNDSDNFDAVVFTLKEKETVCTTIMDIPLQEEEWENEYLRILQDIFEVDINSQRFNSFFNELKHTNIYQYIGYQLIQGQQQYYRPHRVQFITLMVISAFKILSCIFYLNKHQKFGWYDIMNVLVITIFTINEVYCFTIILSNYDLRRKTMMSQQINNAILYSGDAIDYSSVIDITNNISIETWDNSRRSVYLFFSEMQTKLERSYICLLLYYIFVSCIIIAAYGEIYIVIDKESILLEPLIVISSTFTFMFLNGLIFFRIYFGSKYNETFEDAEDKVDLLIGIYQDLIQMYDYNFAQKNIDKYLYIELNQGVCQSELGRESQILEKYQDEINNKNEINSETNSRKSDLNKCASQLEIKKNTYSLTCYDILISKFMYLSDYYIEKGNEFQGKVYKKDQKKELEQKMLENCLKSLKRIKQQIIVDSKLQCYKAFNIIKLDFQETLLTISLGLLTLLPSIITKFIEQFDIAIYQLK